MDGHKPFTVSDVTVATYIKGDANTSGRWIGDECPVTYISQESIRLVELYCRNGHAVRAFGAPMMRDYGKLPIRLVDAFVVLDTEDKAVEQAAIGAAQAQEEPEP